LLAKNTKLGSFELAMMVSVVMFLVVTIVLHLDDDYIEAKGERMNERMKGKKIKIKRDMALVTKTTWVFLLCF
jgi:energy-converting hydrogenase Eha subunit H